MIRITRLAGSFISAFLICLFVTLVSFKRPYTPARSVINLAGKWSFELDSANSGIKDSWFSGSLSDSIHLPGTTDINHKGKKNMKVSTMSLNRVYTYEGPAWYKKDIVIPQNWKGKYIELFMERTKASKVWIDGHYAGASVLLESAHRYNLTKFLTPGKHTIAIRIDNTLKLTPYGNVHIYSDDTQTNWNGIIGDFHLEASDKSRIRDIQVYPDIDNRKIRFNVSIDHPQDLDKVNIAVDVIKELNGSTVALKPARYTVKADSIITMEYVLGDGMDVWDEYSQPVYQLAITLSAGKYRDQMAVPFGMRKVAGKGTKLTVNGRTVFLRGKHDACVFPLTGFPPMDIDGWLKVFKIARSYGINHYRFHSWCPPEAAFDAADKLGIYLQPELPFWGQLESDTTAAQLQEEGLALLKSYANHPSFVMFGAGNEIGGNFDRLKRIMTVLKSVDNRPLYSQGSNNGIGYVAPMEFEDYHVAARTPYAHDTILTHTRLTHAFADSREGGILNTRPPSANINFDYAVSQIKIPLIGHEIGQYQVYPDYREIQKYTGVLRASNLEEFRRRLEKAGMLDQNVDFQKASGAWSALCYRAEIEAALRTKGFAGFHLLDLQDFPGQGTALVGMLDAFMDSKGIISANEWKQFCNDVTPLLSFDKYCWTTKEQFYAVIRVANYSNKNIRADLKWFVRDSRNKVIKEGMIDKAQVPSGELTSLGQLEVPLSGQKQAEKLTVTLQIDGYENSWPVWVYPNDPVADYNGKMTVATSIDHALIQKLKEGGNVLLFPEAKLVSKNSVGGLFPPEFWNYGMFKGISEWVKKPVSPGTLGILTNPQHPLFNSFPTDFHTNWQWWSIVRNSNALILDGTSAGYRPIVQVIDNLERNHKLGLIFECKIGKGKLLVCMSRLNEMPDNPEAVQLYNSIIRYMSSGSFDPGYEMEENELMQLFQ